jgi:hypothetical protein
MIFGRTRSGEAREPMGEGHKRELGKQEQESRRKIKEKS